jgi:hypothetical protein
LLGRESRDANYFSPAAPAGGYGNGGSRYPQKIGEEFEASLVGLARDGRCGEREFEPAAEFTRDPIASSPSLHFDREGRPLRGVADFNHDRSARHPGDMAIAAPLQYSVMASWPEPDPIFDLLKRAQTIAVVGLSNSPLRPSHGVSAYLQTHGYRIIPVNPNIPDALGERAYASLLDVPGSIDIVNIFRRSEFVEEIVDQAIQRKLPVIWMQEEVINQKAAEKARRAGIFVIMDRCILREHKARFA